MLSIFSGIFYPVATLPGVLQAISKAIPASYVFESMRTILTTGVFSSELAFRLLVSFVLAVIYLALAYLFFIRIYKHNLRTGTLARFEIE